MQLKTTPEDFRVREVMVPTLAPGKYRLYLLEKRKWNTEDVLQELSRSLNISRKRFAVCGNKDKHALTEQYLTIENGPEYIRSPRDTRITYLGTMAQPLRLGAHQSNWFCITAREAKQTREMPSKIKNYFGEQRFGENNLAVGFALIKKNYHEAAKLLKLPETKDPISELRKVPRHTLLLYVHAVQSLLWNEVAAQLKEQETVYLPGFAEEGTAQEQTLMKKALEKYSLVRGDFLNKSLQELTLDGTQRKLYQDVRDLTVSENNGAVITCFSLGTGSYATETIKQLVE